MNMKNLIVMMIIFLILSCSTNKTVITKEPDTWDRYLPLSFKEIMQEHEGVFEKVVKKNETESTVVTWNINGLALNRPYLIQSNYLNLFRPITKEHQELLHYWNTAFDVPELFINAFKQEAAFEIEGRTYWCPIQESLIPYLKAEASSGSPIRIYTMLIGSTPNDNKHVPLFIINEFQIERSSKRNH